MEWGADRRKVQRRVEIIADGPRILVRDGRIERSFGHADDAAPNFLRYYLSVIGPRRFQSQ